jgi:hypothetical protein
LLLSEDTANQTTLDCRYLGRFEVKGRNQPLPIHQCLEALGSDERQAIMVGKDEFTAITELPGTMVQETHLDSMSAYSAKYPADSAVEAIRQLIMREG